jgi:hypothetical protein
MKVSKKDLLSCAILFTLRADADDLVGADCAFEFGDRYTVDNSFVNELRPALFGDIHLINKLEWSCIQDESFDCSEKFSDQDSHILILPTGFLEDGSSYQFRLTLDHLAGTGFSTSSCEVTLDVPDSDSGSKVVELSIGSDSSQETAYLFPYVEHYILCRTVFEEDDYLKLSFHMTFENISGSSSEFFDAADYSNDEVITKEHSSIKVHDDWLKVGSTYRATCTAETPNKTYFGKVSKTFIT